MGSRLHLRINGTATSFTGLGTIPISETGFYTLTRTTSGVFSVYRNGVKSGTSLTSTVDFQYQYIGQSYAGAWLSSGLLDEFSIFNTHFSDAEAQELFADSVIKDATTHSKSGNLLGYWRNDGISTWQDRRGWSYLNWDANTEKVQASTTLDGTYTISAWVNLSATGTNSYIVDFRTSSGTGYWLFNTSNPSAFIISSGTSYVNGSTGTTITAGGWNHVVVTGITIDASVAKIGIANDGTYATWQGGIKSVSIYSGTKSASDVTALFNNGINYNQSSEANLVHYWEMDNGTTVTDLKGSSNGTVTGASLNTGNNGTVAGTPDSITIREGLNSNKDGLGFPLTNPTSNIVRFSRNGLAEHLSIPTTKGFDVQEAFTVECWFKQPDMGTGYQHLINRDDVTNRNWLIVLTNGTIEVGLFSGGSYSNTVTSGTYDDDNWHHLCVVVTTGTSVQIYIDTVLAKLNTTSIPTTIDNDPSAFQIGNRSGTDQFFIGSIDEVRFYNKALTAFEADGSAPEEGETATSGELVKNYKHGKGKHKND